MACQLVRQIIQDEQPQINFYLHVRIICEMLLTSLFTPSVVGEWSIVMSILCMGLCVQYLGLEPLDVGCKDSLNPRTRVIYQY